MPRDSFIPNNVPHIVAFTAEYVAAWDYIGTRWWNYRFPGINLLHLSKLGFYGIDPGRSFKASLNDGSSSLIAITYSISSQRMRHHLARYQLPLDLQGLPFCGSGSHQHRHQLTRRHQQRSQHQQRRH